MSETGENKGAWAVILAVFTVLAQIWSAIPKESRDKLIATIVEGFDGILRRFFRKYHGVEAHPAQPGQEVAC